MWGKMAVASFKIFRHLSGGTEENYETISSQDIWWPAIIIRPRSPDTCLKRYGSSQLALQNVEIKQSI
jgi:hypothetical protein